MDAWFNYYGFEDHFIVGHSKSMGTQLLVILIKQHNKFDQNLTVNKIKVDLSLAQRQ